MATRFRYLSSIVSSEEYRVHDNTEGAITAD